MPPCGNGNLTWWWHLVFHLIIYIVQLCDEGCGICECVKLSGLALQSSRYNCLVLMPHRQLDFSACMQNLIIKLLLLTLIGILLYR